MFLYSFPLHQRPFPYSSSPFHCMYNVLSLIPHPPIGLCKCAVQMWTMECERVVGECGSKRIIVFEPLFVMYVGFELGCFFMSLFSSPPKHTHKHLRTQNNIYPRCRYMDLVYFFFKSRAITWRTRLSNRSTLGFHTDIFKKCSIFFYFSPLDDGTVFLGGFL